MKDVKTIESVKREAKAITRATKVTHSQVLDVLSVQAGYSHWGAYQEALMQQQKDEVERIPQTVRPIDLMKMLIAEMPYVRPEVESARHLIITGGTSTGKTTVVNRLLEFVPRGVLVTALEEGREIMNPNPIGQLDENVREMRRTHSGVYEHTRMLATSKGAGVIVYGEMGSHNTDEVVKAMRQTNGPMVMTTMHATDPSQVRAMISRYSYEGLYLRDDDRIACMQMTRDNKGVRVISDITTV